MEKILEVFELSKTYKSGDKKIKALDKISFYLEKGESLGIVGESGSGKSTLAKIISLLEMPDEGNIRFKNKDIASYKSSERRNYYRHLQMVFQDPMASFNPRMRIGKAIIDSVVNFGKTKSEALKTLPVLLEMVGLETEYSDRYPHEISGGECQRAAIARAIASEPEIVIFDEATSSLDLNIQAQIIALIKRLHEKRGMSMIVISHDIASIQLLCDRIAVMCDGRIEEQGKSFDVINSPKSDYTKNLIDAHLTLNGDL